MPLSFLDTTHGLLDRFSARRPKCFAPTNQQFGLILCEAQLNWRDILSYLAEVLDRAWLSPRGWRMSGYGLRL